MNERNQQTTVVQIEDNRIHQVAEVQVHNNQHQEQRNNPENILTARENLTTRNVPRRNVRTVETQTTLTVPDTESELEIKNDYSMLQESIHNIFPILMDLIDIQESPEDTISKKKRLAQTIEKSYNIEIKNKNKKDNETKKKGQPTKSSFLTKVSNFMNMPQQPQQPVNNESSPNINNTKENVNVNTKENNSLTSLKNLRVNAKDKITINAKENTNVYTKDNTNIYAKDNINENTKVITKETGAKRKEFEENSEDHTVENQSEINKGENPKDKIRKINAKSIKEINEGKSMQEMISEVHDRNTWLLRSPARETFSSEQLNNLSPTPSSSGFGAAIVKLGKWMEGN